MKRTVWVATSGIYSNFSVEGVFSSEDLARKCGDDARPYVVDDRVGERYQNVWSCNVSKSDGSFGYMSNRWAFWKGRKARVEDFGSYFHVESPISERHAMKVAAETRQAWLRQQAQPQPPAEK